MNIQFNTDKSVNGTEELIAPFVTQLEEELSRFSSHITRVEVHLSDEKGKKDGINDIRCLLEARLEGRAPIAVSNQADTIEQSVAGSIDKLKASLKTILGRIAER